MKHTMCKVALMAAIGVAGMGAAMQGTPVAAQESACPVTQAVQQLSGVGDTVTQPVSVPAGLLTISGSYQGEENFIVWWYDLNGNRDLVFNEIGSYGGQHLVSVEATTTLVFEVTASGGGSWSLDLSVMQ